LEENLLGQILLVSGVFFAIFRTRRPHKLEACPTRAEKLGWSPFYSLRAYASPY